MRIFRKASYSLFVVIWVFLFVVIFGGEILEPFIPGIDEGLGMGFLLLVYTAPLLILCTIAVLSVVLYRLIHKTANGTDIAFGLLGLGLVLIPLSFLAEIWG